MNIIRPKIVFSSNSNVPRVQQINEENEEEEKKTNEKKTSFTSSRDQIGNLVGME